MLNVEPKCRSVASMSMFLMTLLFSHAIVSGQEDQVVRSPSPILPRLLSLGFFEAVFLSKSAMRPLKLRPFVCRIFHWNRNIPLW